MAKSIIEKLRIKENDILFTIHAPTQFEQELGKLPSEVNIVSTGKNYTQVHWFVLNKAQLEKEIDKIMKLLKDGIIIWVYYPKASSKMQTDLTRDKGWDCLLNKGDQLTWISLISFNDTWSVFGFRLKNNADRKKEEQPKKREIFNWINPKTKEVILPEDLLLAFKKSKTAQTYFDSLSFTNKKEYIEWIVTAKRPETKKERIIGTIERLNKHWKNPRNQ